MKKTCLAAFALFGAVAYGLNWDNALIMGTTPGGKMFYEPGEEMVFTLKLEGMKEITIAEHSVTITSALNDASRAQIAALAEELAK